MLSEFKNKIFGVRIAILRSLTMKKRLYITLILAFAVTFCFAQEDSISFDPDKLIMPIEEVMPDAPKLKKEEEKKGKMGMQAGMGMSVSKQGSSPFYYFNPSYTKTVGKKTSVQVGTSFSHSSFPTYNRQTGESGTGSMTSVSVYAAGEYELSEKLTVNAAVQHTVYNSPLLKNYNSNNNSLGQHSSTSMNVGLTYKPSPKTTFGVQVHMQDKPLYQPGNYYMHRPFSPFVPFTPNINGIHNDYRGF